MSLRIYRLQLSLAIYLVLVTLVLFYKSDLTHDKNGNLKTTIDHLCKLHILTISLFFSGCSDNKLK